MAKNRYDSKRVFRRKPGGPWYAWLYEIDAHGVRQRTRFSTGQLDKQAAIAVLVDRERAAAQAPHGLATDAAGRTVADALEYLLSSHVERNRGRSAIVTIVFATANTQPSPP